MRHMVVVVALVVCPLVASAQPSRLAADPAPVPQAPPNSDVPPQPGPDPHESMRRFDPDAPPPSEWRFMLSDLTVFRLNPLGLETRARLGFQKRLYYSEKAAAKNNFGFLGFYPKLNPAAAMLGVGGEIQPLSILNVKVMGEVQKYFGTFGFLQSFTSADQNYSDSELDRLENVREPQRATMLHFGVAPLLQLRFAKNKIAVRSLTQLDYWDIRIRGGSLAYEATYDTLLPDNGWTFSMDNELLYVGVPNLAIGLRHSMVQPFYKREHFASQAQFDAYDNQNAHHRLGLFLAKTLRDDGPSTFNKPMILLIVSWYLNHQFRTGTPDSLPMGHVAGDYTSRAVPYFLIGFAFESDFMKVSRSLL